MNNLHKKLEAFKSDIEKATALDKNIENIISIDLYDFIHESKDLKEKFYSIFDYFKNLVKNDEYIKTENELFDSILKMASFTNQREIDQLNEELKGENRHLFIKLKGEDNHDIELKDLYQKIQDKNNYYELGNVSISSIDDPFIFTRTWAIRNQYSAIGHMFSVISWSINERNENEYEKFEVLFNNFKKLLDKFDNLIYRVPIRMKLRNFEKFLIFCVQRYPRADYEAFYNMRGDDLIDNNKILKKIKNNAEIVLNHLIETLPNEKEGEDLEEKISYKYLDGNKPKGTLHLGKKRLSFDKTPAMIINFFIESNKINGEFLTYNDFNKFIENDHPPINSDEFNKSINQINKRINKENKLIREIIIKGENKKQEANIYRWNDKIF
ncbi:MAG: hypothetical protein WC518_04175 [Patescibacteria group bacterium]